MPRATSTASSHSGSGELRILRRAPSDWIIENDCACTATRGERAAKADRPGSSGVATSEPDLLAKTCLVADKGAASEGETHASTTTSPVAPFATRLAPGTSLAVRATVALEAALATCRRS